jgi:photosystem II stability/assembly factor-like uncharacterized protein
MRSLYLFLFVIFLFSSCTKKKVARKETEQEETAHSDWFSSQRMFPYATIDYTAYKNAVQWKNNQQAALHSTSLQSWRYAGPENLGGRLVDVEMLPNDFNTVYVCAASGGIFKSTNAGNSWAPIFDNNPSLSIGDLAIAPSNSNILYCGTGEANAGGGSLCYDGAGIFKSTDAGATWNYSGLELTRNTGRIAVDPNNPDRAFAATMGDLFGENPDRGLYRTTDGGNTWQQVLSRNDSTGAIDVVIHPQHGDTVFACLWTRVRRPDRRNYGGPESGIYRSLDGGDTWTRLTQGLPTYSLGRIGIDISKSNPDILYAIMSDSSGGNSVVMKSVDLGDSWTNVTSNLIPNTYSYWYGRIKIDPVDPDIVYALDLDLWKTDDGGQNWYTISAFIHVDQHEVFVHPQNSNMVVVANDGGLFFSQDGGFNWSHSENLPIMQFYTCEVDEQNPASIYGGAQDNGVNTTSTGDVDDWYSIWGGDGFVVLVNPDDPAIVYAESQYGYLNTGRDGIDSTDRTNWNTPYIFNPLNPNTLYLGTEALYKTTDQGVSWYPLSGDLTNGSMAVSYPIVFATITTVAVAPSDTNIIYVGTDDGNIQMTTDEGASWNLVSSSLPVRWITHLEVDPRDAMSVYATLSGYRYHDNAKHVYHSPDGGNTWNDISGNLPDVPCNDLLMDTTYSTLYLATDIGVYYSYMGSSYWQLLGSGMPLVPVCDLRLHYPTHKLLAATYGRSMYDFDLNILTAQEEVITPTIPFAVFVGQNPVHELLSLNIYSGKKSNVTISMFDAAGKKVLTDEIKISEGTNYFEKDLSRNSMKAGTYYLQISSEVKSVVKKIFLY